MAEDNAPCSDLVQERLRVRTLRERIAELETALAKTEEDRNFWATDALKEVTRVWDARNKAERWRRYAEHWRGRVRGASEAVRAAMEREKSAWAAWSVVVESLRKEREGAEAEREEWRQSSQANAEEMMRYQIKANRLGDECERVASTVVESRKLLGGIGPDAPPLTEQVRQIVAEQERLVRLLCDLTPGGSEFVGHPDRCAQHIGQEIHGRLKSAINATKRADDAEAERDRLNKIVHAMYAELGADLESGDDPAAEVARCVAERNRLQGRVAELEQLLRRWLYDDALCGASLTGEDCDCELCEQTSAAFSDTSGREGGEKQGV